MADQSQPTVRRAVGGLVLLFFGLLALVAIIRFVSGLGEVIVGGICGIAALIGGLYDTWNGIDWMRSRKARRKALPPATD